MADFNYTIVDNFDHVFDEKGNTFLALRKIQWGESTNAKLDIRKWYVNSDGVETCGKGVSFITEEGPHELTRVLCEQGYGHTEEILDSIKSREDFMPSLSRVLDNGQMNELNIEEADSNYYDPTEALFGNDMEE